MAATLGLVAGIALLLAGASSLQYGGRLQETCEGQAGGSTSGWLCGERNTYKDTIFASFRGVPYAKPPLGELRFKELQPAEKWEGFLDATAEGPICPQHTIVLNPLMEPRGIDEDCITANVHIPLAHRSGRIYGKMPIVVVIHGGVFGIGSGDPDILGPEYFMTRSVIVITFNYRLGALGFLSLNSTSVPGNAGLRDVLTLLEWVQDNGEYFGGDTRDVTLLGHSSGGSIAHLLALSPLTQDKGLFNKIVMMSSVGVRGFFNYNPEYAATAAQAFLTTMGINATDPEQIHQELIAAPISQYIEASRVLQDQNILPTFYPVIESVHEGVKRVIDMDPERQIEIGRGEKIPMLIGFAEYEFSILKPRLEELNITATLTAMPSVVVPPLLAFSPRVSEIIPIMQNRYFAENGTADEFARLLSEVNIVYPSIYVARRRAALGGAESFLYQFTYRGEHRVLDAITRVNETAHFEDLTYLFKQNSAAAVPEDQLDGSQDRVIQNWMLDLFTNYITKSDPAGSYVSWPAVTRFLFRYQEISAASYQVASVESNQELRELEEFYDALYAEYGDF
ncbi:hypothetical protein JYU34_018430 [Plutella xylostella]|uniref:Carboxylic ester hydrolase n=1 Tax=Plutella xylostella TaxID=51655 RepID=A0ABQ7Q1D5_PLUXY|nr:hypothetical protein JYU34_018430 [Plutella xylostella]